MTKPIIYRLKTKIKTFLTVKKITDDYDWDSYHEHYKGELSYIKKNHTQILNHDDYVLKNNELIMKSDILHLHPNHRLLYETILQLAPSSIIEFGCGGGDHLHNINILCPKIKLYGIDISSKMLDILRKRHSELNAEVNQYDITLPYSLNLPIVDIAFTQAVIMHIHTGNSHLVALSNLFRCAGKQVVLMENWARHNFMEDINKLFSLKMLPWSKIFFYYRVSKELKKPHIMIVSSVPLKQYSDSILSDYKLLSDNVTG